MSSSYSVAFVGAISVLAIGSLISGILLLILHQLGKRVIPGTTQASRTVFIEWTACLLFVLGGFFALTLLLSAATDLVALSPDYELRLFIPSVAILSALSWAAAVQLRSGRSWAYHFAFGLFIGLGLLPIVSFILQGSEHGSIVFTLFFLVHAYLLHKPRYRLLFVSKK